MFVFPFCLDRSKIVPCPWITVSRDVLSLLTPRAGAGSPAQASPGYPLAFDMLVVWLWEPRPGSSLVLSPDTEKWASATERQVARVCGCSHCPLHNVIFTGAIGGGRAEPPLGPPPSRGSDWWAWQPLNKYFWCREFTCQLGGAPRGNFQSRSVGENDTAQGSPP